MSNLIQNIMGRLRVSEVSCKRSASFNNKQYEASFTLSYDNGGENQKMSLVEARIAYHTASMQAEESILESAFSAGDLSSQQFKDMITACRKSHALSISKLMGNETEIFGIPLGG